MRPLLFSLAVTALAFGAACNCGLDVAGELDPEGTGSPHTVPPVNRNDAGSGGDAGGAPDAGGEDAGSGDDAGRADGGEGEASVDAGAQDAGADAGVDAGAFDAGFDAGSGPTHVHIYIDNFCNTSVSPTEVYVPLNSGLKLQFHNHSVDYEADVWSSRGYGSLELARGATWNDPITHCGGPNPYSEYFDISIAGGPSSACPGVRFRMYCQ